MGTYGWGVGKANIAFEFKTMQGLRIKQHKGVPLNEVLLACMFHIYVITAIVRDKVFKVIPKFCIAYFYCAHLITYNLIHYTYRLKKIIL